MAKERFMAIFIGVVMVLSAAGFALNSAMNQGFGTGTQALNIPSIVTRQLTLEESVYILSNEGKIIMEFFFSDNCTDCPEKTATLEGFTQRMSDFVVLQEMKGNETSLQVIGSGGRIKDMTNATISDQTLIETLCELAIAQPPECLMR